MLSGRFRCFRVVRFSPPTYFMKPEPSICRNLCIVLGDMSRGKAEKFHFFISHWQISTVVAGLFRIAINALVIASFKVVFGFKYPTSFEQWRDICWMYLFIFDVWGTELGSSRWHSRHRLLFTMKLNDRSLWIEFVKSKRYLSWASSMSTFILGLWIFVLSLLGISWLLPPVNWVTLAIIAFREHH